MSGGEIAIEGEDLEDMSDGADDMEGGDMIDGAGGDDMEGDEGEAVEVELTEEEAAAVQRLQAMFPHLPQMMVVQTYVACGKVEDLCANLLMDGGGM